MATQKIDPKRPMNDPEHAGTVFVPTANAKAGEASPALTDNPVPQSGVPQVVNPGNPYDVHGVNPNNVPQVVDNLGHTGVGVYPNPVRNVHGVDTDVGVNPNAVTSANEPVHPGEVSVKSPRRGK